MGMNWRNMRIQWTSMEGPGVRVNAALVSARVSVAVGRLLLLFLARMRPRDSDGWRVREPEMLVTLTAPSLCELYDRVYPCMTWSILSLACTVWNAMSSNHVSVQRLVSLAGTRWRWLRGLCG